MLADISTLHRTRQWQGFLAAIRGKPGDDGPRLIAADWLEENGAGEYAEYVRLSVAFSKINQSEPLCERHADNMSCSCKECNRYYSAREKATPIHSRLALLLCNEADFLGHDNPLLCDGFQANSTWVPAFTWEWERGFVKSVSCSLKDWCGGVCELCGGKDCRIIDTYADGRTEEKHCPGCGGAGRVEGHGPAVVRTQPILSVAIDDHSHLHKFRDGTFAITKEKLDEELWRCVAGDPHRHHDTFRGTDAEVQKVLSDGLIRWALANGEEDEREHCV